MSTNKKIACTATEYAWLKRKLGYLEGLRIYGQNPVPGSIVDNTIKTIKKLIAFTGCASKHSSHERNSSKAKRFPKTSRRPWLTWVSRAIYN